MLGNNPTVVQERLFTYNNKEQLVSETQPGHGTTTPGTKSCAYNFDGSLQEKTDPKGQKVQWFYDALGRTTEVKKLQVGGTEDLCGKVKYQYDSQDKDGTFAGTNLAGRAASVETGCSQRGGLVQELYSYNVAGAVTTKRVRIIRGSSTVTKNIGYTFDAEGKPATVQYPDVSLPFTYYYDNMGRPNCMTGIGWDSDQGTITSDHVSGVSYGLGGELLGMTYLQSSPMPGDQQQNRWFVETRSYNSRLQLTRQTTALNAGATVTDVKYNFSATVNDGRIESRENLVSGEVVNYQYDSLKRLTSATQTAPVIQPPDLQWGLSFTYDGFGNRWNQTIQQGKKGLTNTLTFDEARNRITGQFWGYDANGNTTGMPQTSDLSYDVDNRLLTITREGSSEAYGYLADNKRFWKSAGGVESYYLYGVGGQRILSYSATFSGGVLTLGSFPKMDVVFAGRVIRANGVAVVMDRLGSVVTRSTGAGTVANHRYYPYGEEIEATVGDRNKFGTYHRDQTGLDYANQRFYASSAGRFITVDPIGDGGNWTNYAGSDPINRNDPSGLATIVITDINVTYHTPGDVVWCEALDRHEPAGTCPSLHSFSWLSWRIQTIFQPPWYPSGSGGGGGISGGDSTDPEIAALLTGNWEAVYGNSNSGAASQGSGTSVNGGSYSGMFESSSIIQGLLDMPVPPITFTSSYNVPIVPELPVGPIIGTSISITWFPPEATTWGTLNWPTLSSIGLGGSFDLGIGQPGPGFSLTAWFTQSSEYAKSVLCGFGTSSTAAYGGVPALTQSYSGSGMLTGVSVVSGRFLSIAGGFTACH